MPIKVVIVEDHSEYRESISFILQSTEGFLCTGKFSSVNEALRNSTKTNVILLDINLPQISGIEGIGKLKEKYPDASIIMLTVYDDDENIFRAITAGADGYILKKTPPIRILQAIEDVVQGGSPMSPSVAKQALNLFKSYAPAKLTENDLSVREKEILSLIVDGLSNDEISSKLFISLQTVRNHIRHIYEKLHVHSKAQAVAKAIKGHIT
ncbi:MAG: response regulator transcription factor [Bacteroidota bacterium]